MSDIQATKQVIADLKDTIKDKEAAESLMRSGAFKRLILNNFCKTKVLSQMELAVSGKCHDVEHVKADALAGLFLKEWLNSVMAMGLRAEEMLPQYEEELNTLIAEGNRNEEEAE